MSSSCWARTVEVRRPPPDETVKPGEQLAAGRDSDVFAYGEHRVLRRSRRGHSMEVEARTMEYARAHGYPVPTVDEVGGDGTELVMERIEGPLMITSMARRPWAIGRFGNMLAGLHQQLHAIPAPGWARDAPCGRGDRLLHLDLHPLNVILSPSGPVVIDWANAARGEGVVDVALTWLLLAAGDNPAGPLKAALTNPFRSWLIRALLAPFDLNQLRAVLPEVTAWKVADPNMTESERDAMRTFAGWEG